MAVRITGGLEIRQRSGSPRVDETEGRRERRGGGGGGGGGGEGQPGGTTEGIKVLVIIPIIAAQPAHFANGINLLQALTGSWPEPGSGIPSEVLGSTWSVGGWWRTGQIFIGGG